MPKKTTKEEAILQIKNISPFIKIIEWHNPKSKLNVFLDSRNNKEFNYYSFSKMKQLLLENPDYDFTTTSIERRIQTNNKRHGAGHAVLVPKFKKKIIETNLKRYGTKAPAQNDEIRKKIIKHHKEKGISKVLGCGKTLKELSQENSIPYTTLWKYNNLFNDYKKAMNVHRRNETDIEVKIKDFLSNSSVKFIQNKSISSINGNFRPDFFIEDNNLIIECDGLYWHSEAMQKEADFHKRKKSIYENAEIRSLFFYSNEIEDKFDIVKSIINNKLGKSRKIYARNCVVDTCGRKDFFDQNHLMGRGQGKIYYLKDKNGDIVSAIQVKYKDKANKTLEVSRFCNKNGLIVTGGFSKLIKHVIKENKPNSIITFIDKRYGDGRYLEKLGWKKVSEFISFKWTDYKNVFHRMNFWSNSGYKKNLVKIWDCGQVKWRLSC